jgi:hypothetical protein
MMNFNNDSKKILDIIKGGIDTTNKLISDGLASKEVSDYRYKICTSCPYFNKKFGTCYLCGCFMIAKTKVATASCPDTPSRWAIQI